MRTYVRSSFALIALGSVILAASAAGSMGAPKVKAAQNATSITIRLGNNPDHLDPIFAINGDSRFASLMAYDTLLASVHGKIKPQLATRWVATPNSIKLWLRKDVTCSDGYKLTAKDYAANVRRFVNPKSPSKDATFVFGSLKVKAFANNAQNTLTIRLAKPYGNLLAGMPLLFVVCPAGLKDPSKLGKQTFGTGPYILKEAVPDDHYTYTKRTGYKWGPNGATTKPPRMPRQVVLRVVQNDTTAANLLLSGGLDVAHIVGPDRARIERDKSFHRDFVTPSLWNLIFNHHSGLPGADKNVRMGLTLAVNRVDLSTAAGGQFARIANSWLTPDATCYSPGDVKVIPRFNLAAARQKFAAAGYSSVNGKLMKNGEQLRVRVRVWNAQTPAVDYLISAYSKLGIDVDGRAVPGSELGQIFFTKFDWDVSLDNSLPTDTLLAGLLTTGSVPPTGQNVLFAKNKTYDSLASKAQKKLTSTQCKLWVRANRSLIEQADLLPLYWEDVATYSRDVAFNSVPYYVVGVYPTSLRTK